uniref:Uncharacterized protein n=1 Tax=Xiphophorus couchianus TaxID=32473 RepID=A0A3B5M7K7_9TELE
QACRARRFCVPHFVRIFSEWNCGSSRRTSEHRATAPLMWGICSHICSLCVCVCIYVVLRGFNRDRGRERKREMKGGGSDFLCGVEAKEKKKKESQMMHGC